MFPFPKILASRWRAPLATAIFLAGSIASAAPVHHDLHVTLDPARARIDVTDTIQLPDSHHGEFRVLLGAAFAPHADGARLVPLDGAARGRFRAYRLIVPESARSVTLRHAGRIEETTRSADHGMPVALLDAEGAYLDGASGWVPRLGDALTDSRADSLTFSLVVDAPADWTIVSQGRRSDDGRHWQADTPQDDVYLVAGRFTRSARTHGDMTLETYLLADDTALAERYLAVMGQYIDIYSELIGAYPYPRFAVVENRWQTGYGMPSFTLLGSQVLRLPFILHSSLPHEILHNWWGNGVWVDASGGNWSEGLTAYLADHLIKEAQGSGAEYRRKLLERYTSFAAEGRDIALRDFRSRHSDATQAVGYGKTLMLFHMLRRQIGDAAFATGLKTLWQRHRFTAATFDDVAAALGPGKEAFDVRWRDRPGAPQLVIDSLDVQPATDGGHRLTLVLRQQQSGTPYPFEVPVVVQTEGGGVTRLSAEFVGDRARLTHDFTKRPLRVDVDPDFDVFRRLDPAEQPSSLARLFGAREQWLVLPADAPPAERDAWQQLAEAWSERFDNVRVRMDVEAKATPDDAAVWLLGWQNRALPASRARLAGSGQALEGRALRVGNSDFDGTDHAFVVLDPDNRRPPLGFIAAPDAAAIHALARKLPHYSTYGRLVFDTPNLDKRLGDALPVIRSPLRRMLDDVDPGPPPAGGTRLVDQVSVPLRFD